MEIQILSQEPRILVGGRLVELGPPKERLVLAILAHSAGKVVPVRVLIDRAWGQDTPASIRTSLYSHITRIRRRLREAGAENRLESRSHGYVLEATPDSVDLYRAQRLCGDGEKRLREGEHQSAAELLSQALGLWKGDPLVGVPGAWAEATRDRIEEIRLKVLMRWAEAQAELGEYDEAADRLAEACAQSPGNDSLVHTRMRVLAAAGRQSEAVECYGELRDFYREERGVEPNPRTRRLFQELLEGDRRTEERASAPERRVDGPGPVVFDNLEAGLPDFVTREAELERLLAGARTATATTVVQVVEGSAGVGKTSLAVKAAQILREDYDVVIHLLLRGTNGPVQPAHALHRLLLMLGVPHEQIPQGVGARADLWRTRLSRHRALIVLDDAVRGQVAPLVPGVAGSTVLVTSRQKLTELDGARTLTLGPLSPSDSVRMLSALTGKDAEPEAAGRLASLLGGLPLGLRLAAGRLRRHPTWPLDYLADRIARNGIEEVSAGERDLTSVFELSYTDLSPRARSAFLAMGMHPTAEASLHVVAAVLGDWDGAEGAMEELLGVHLVEEAEPNAYRMHELLRSFARHRATEVLSPGERRSVGHRFLDHYLAIADVVDRAVAPGRSRLDVRPTHTSRLPRFEDAREAGQWFSTHFPEIEAAVGYAHSHGFMGHAARIPLALAGLLDKYGPWDGAEALYLGAVEAWRWIGRGPGLGRALYELGRVRWRLRDLPAAVEDIRAALAESERRGDRTGHAWAMDQLGLIRQRSGDDRGALAEYREALTEFRALGDDRGVAQVFNHMGISQSILGQYEASEASLTTSVALHRLLGDINSAAQVQMNLSRGLYLNGYHRDVRRACERGLAVFKQTGDDRSVAKVMQGMGLVAEYKHQYEEALDCFTEARRLLRSREDEAEIIEADAGLAAALLGLGRHDEADALLESALRRVRALGVPELEARLLLVQGDARVEDRRFSEARLCYRNARELARRGGERSYEARAHDLLGDLLRREGRESEALEHWNRAITLLKGVQNPHLGSIRIKVEMCSRFGS
ncbi:BTAD domain-containing putative transcriptional regulator [Nocardiopsis tropica]|uniref:AfsR/SARP family transcriptional regulator n=1 Tax=Nocardiopsis tropica TaxID=109330 RepID=UPI002E8B6935|nr:BTAD domain-containing putative transcriptional regulator [Nocardiopsis tropica]